MFWGLSPPQSYQDIGDPLQEGVSRSEGPLSIFPWWDLSELMTSSWCAISPHSKAVSCVLAP